MTALPLLFGMMAVAALAAQPRILARMALRGAIRKNFRGDMIPVAGGILILAYALPALVAVELQVHTAAPYLMALVAMGLLGAIDDKWGDRSVGGLRGHVMALLRDHRLTTGLAKAVGGLLACIAIARFALHLSASRALVAGCAIALSANAHNLLDVRPGRAGAVFLVASLVPAAALFARLGPEAALPIAVLWLGAGSVYRQDRAGKLMLGDAGSNLLGAALGLVVVQAVGSAVGEAIILTALVLFHLLTERVSLSALIDRFALLRTADRWTGVR